MAHKVKVQHVDPTVTGGNNAYVWAECSCGWEGDQWIGTLWGGELKALGDGLAHTEQAA